MWIGLIFIYVDAYLGLGDWFAKIFLAAFIFGIIAAPFWYKIAELVEKKTVWCVGMLLFSVTCISTSLLEPGEVGFFTLAVLKVINTLAFISINIMAPSTLSDIVDYSTWKSGVNRSASFFALYSFLVKLVGALGGGLGLVIAGWSGFEAGSVIQTESSVYGLHMAIAWIPALLTFISAILILYMPITGRRHVIVRRRIDAVSNAG